MKEIRMRAFFGILGLAGAGFLLSAVTTSSVGCSSSGGSTGSAGSTGNAGTTGTAGTTGQAGTTGSGGSGGGGGASVALGCQASQIAMGDPIIADFTEVDGGGPVFPIGGLFTYGSPAPVATATGGAWHITLTAPGTASAQYLGVGIYFNGNSAGTECVDATAHTGVQFDISGSVGGTMCSAQYSTNDSAHSNSATDPKGSGDSTSYAPQASLTVTSAVTTVMMPFVGGPSGGNPAVGVAKDKLTGVQWQFTVGAGTTSNCDVEHHDRQREVLLDQPHRKQHGQHGSKGPVD